MLHFSKDWWRVMVWNHVPVTKSVADILGSSIVIAPSALSANCAAQHPRNIVISELDKLKFYSLHPWLDDPTCSSACCDDPASRSSRSLLRSRPNPLPVQRLSKGLKPLKGDEENIYRECSNEPASRYIPLATITVIHESTHTILFSMWSCLKFSA